MLVVHKYAIPSADVFRLRTSVEFDHVGTFQILGGQLVFHLFEVLP